MLSSTRRGCAGRDVVVNDLVNWADVEGWTGHGQLLAKHGLVDGLTMASALHEVERRAHLVLEIEGYQALAEWLLRQDEPKMVLRIPDEVAHPLWEASPHQFQQGRCYAISSRCKVCTGYSSGPTRLYDSPEN